MLYESRAAIWNALQDSIEEDEGTLQCVTVTVVTTDAEGKITMVHMGYPEADDFDDSNSDGSEYEYESDSGQDQDQMELGI